MKGIALAAFVSAAFSAPAMAQAADPAQTDPAPAAEASPHTVTGNLGVFSSYRFRGIDQTFGKPALQGGRLRARQRLLPRQLELERQFRRGLPGRQSGNGFLRWLQGSPR